MPALPIIVAIVGGSASGKTRFAAHLKAGLAPLAAAVVREDSYYWPAAIRPEPDPALTNFDLAGSKDLALLARHLRQARAGKPFDEPLYDFARHDRTGILARIAPGEVLILEGLHSLAALQIRELVDLALFIEAPTASRRARRLARDVAERGRDPVETARVFDEVVEPMHVLHVQPLKALAHRVIANDGHPEHLAAAARALAEEIKANF